MDKDLVRGLLREGLEADIFPGAQAAIFHEGRLIGPVCVGMTSHAHSAPRDGPPSAVEATTRYDLASLTKALVTAPLTWYALGQGLMSPESPIGQWLGEWVQNDVERAQVTVRHLLTHTSGLPAWLPLYHSAALAHPGGDRAGVAAVVRRLALSVTPVGPPRMESCYSDLGYILLGILLERALGRPLDELAEEVIFTPLGMRSAGFVRLIEGERLMEAVAATEETEARPGAGCVSGEVHDENAWALGGVAGHAGLFGTCEDVVRFCEALLKADGGPPAPWPIPSAMVRWAMSGRSAAIDSFGLRLGSYLGGLDTPSDTGSTAGPYLATSPAGVTVGHLGFTGTSMWIDRSRQLAVVLLTNRVHPNRDREGIRDFRVRFHEEVTANTAPARHWAATPEVPELLGLGAPCPVLGRGGMRELEVAVNAARRAGVMARHRFEESIEVSHKGEVELVTQADLDCEGRIVETIRAAFPTHGFLAEEAGRDSGSSACTWIIDPIDGTTNFAHGTPHFAMCIALLVDDQLQIGVIYDPMRDEMFTARRGFGAWLNGRRMSVSRCQALGKGLAATGFPYDRRTSDNNNMDYLDEMVRATQGIRRMGSAGLDMAYVAAGRLDLYWELRVKPWDIGAGLILVEEAGGRVTDMQGKAFHIGRGDILATCGGRVHAEAVERLTRVAMARRK